MIEKIQKLFDEEITPALAGHGGGIELVKYENNILYVKLSGGCRGCPGARMTMKNGVERIVQNRFPEIKEVVDVTDHR